MSLQRSPLKARDINLNENSIRKQIGKKQLKRKSSLFGSLDSKEPPKKRLFVDLYDDSLDSFADSCSQNNSLYSLSKKSNSPVKKYVAALPVDLRLATKIRVISERPFPFSDTSSNSNFSGRVAFDSSILDESYKLFTQADLSSVHLPGLKTAPSLSILKTAGLYYQFPDIGYMQMFPRLDGISRTKGIRTSLLSFGSEVVDAVQADWFQSFDHLFNSWKSGKRNSFYLCGPLFTILFIKNWKSPDADLGFESEYACTGLDDFWEHRVIITPTTFGFRKLLTSKGIPFVLPLQCGEEQERENWLRGIGFSPSKIKLTTGDSQDQFSPEDSNGGNSTLNSTAESTIAIVQLEAIDAFCKLMLDMNLGWAKSGQQAGLPPTIIATESFLNAALKSLNFKTQVLKKPEGTQYTLDVDDGPILPHVSQLLHEFFRSCNTLDGNTLKVHVNGRTICDGFNEATAEGYKNLNEFAFDGVKCRYFY